MKKTILLVLIAFAIMLTFNQCKKGDTGPAGPAGVNGINGTNGTDGANGNANVLNYDFTVSSSQWTYDNLYERWYFRYSSSVNSNSAILGYVMSGSGKQAMPYQTCPSFMCEQYDFATYLFGSPPYIEFQYTNLDTRTIKPSNDVYYYLIIIQPSQKKLHPTLNWNNYEEVKKAFNLGEPIKINAGEIIK